MVKRICEPERVASSVPGLITDLRALTNTWPAGGPSGRSISSHSTFQGAVKTSPRDAGMDQHSVGEAALRLKTGTSVGRKCIGREPATIDGPS